MKIVPTDKRDFIVIKKYNNRRLYNTSTSSYVTLATLSGLVKQGQEFVVKEAKSDKDITHSVLLQIIFEEENKNGNLLTISFLRELIRFYGENLQNVVPEYLENSMMALSRNREHLRPHRTHGEGYINQSKKPDHVSEQKWATPQRSEGIFKSYRSRNGIKDSMNYKPFNKRSESKPIYSNAELDRLRQQLAQMQQQLNSLSEKS